MTIYIPDKYAEMKGSDYAVVPVYFNDKIIGYIPAADARIPCYRIVEFS